MLRLTGLLPLLLLLLLQACHSAGTPGAAEAQRLDHAALLRLTDRADGSVLVSVADPWDSLGTPRLYLLVSDSMAGTPDVPQGATLVRTPLRRAVLWSGIHLGLLEELGVDSLAAGICDAPFITSPAMLRRLAKGSLADCGSTMAPEVERILSARPDGLLLSPYDDGAMQGPLTQLAIPVIECSDYLERDPLGRAEWIRLYGRLFGCAARADSLFEAVAAAYEAVRDGISPTAQRPAVLTDTPYGGLWYVPGRHTTMATLIRDAGGVNPFDCFDTDKSVPLSAEEVYGRASGADIWLLRYVSPDSVNDRSLFADRSPLFPQFKAWRTNRLYGCNTVQAPYYETLPFHPEVILAEMAAVIAGDTAALRFYKPL